jgi:hypothetical protein
MKKNINNSDHNYIVEEKYKLHPILDRYIFLKSHKTFYGLEAKQDEELQVLRELGKSSKEFQKFDQSNWHDNFLKWANGITHPDLSEYHTGLKYIYDKRKSIKDLITEHPDAKHNIIVASHLKSTVDVFRKKIFETYIFLLNRDAFYHKLNDILPDDFSITEIITENVLRSTYPVYYEIIENDWKKAEKFINSYNEVSGLSITFYDLSPLWSFAYSIDYFEKIELIAAIDNIYDVEIPESELNELSTMNDLACAIKRSL